MISDKLKKHYGKVTFFAASLLLVLFGTFYLKQKNNVKVQSVNLQQNNGYVNNGSSLNSTGIQNQNTLKSPSSTTKTS